MKKSIAFLPLAIKSAASFRQVPAIANGQEKTFKDFVYVMLYTGLRISDVATFDTSLRLNDNQIFLRMRKTQKEIYTWVPEL